MANEDIFSSDPLEPAPSSITLDDLVGEDKKYKDPNEVAKAYVHAEGHIRTLERDLADLKAKADLANNPTPTPSNPDPGQGRPADQQPEPRSDPSKVDENDFRSRIREEVKNLNESERAQANAEAAARKMVEVYGDASKANEAVRRRADELGVSVEWLRDSAAKSPTAFFATMGMNGDPTRRETPSPNNEVNLGNRGEQRRNFEYYDKIRKDDPKLYFSAAVQREMMSQAKSQGGEFYKR